VEPGVDAIRPLPCPACGLPQDLFRWLDQARHAVRGAHRVRTWCADCGAGAELELEPGRLALGVADAQGGFRPLQRAEAPGLDVRWHFEGADASLHHRRFVWGRSD